MFWLILFWPCPIFQLHIWWPKAWLLATIQGERLPNNYLCHLFFSFLSVPLSVGLFGGESADFALGTLTDSSPAFPTQSKAKLTSPAAAFMRKECKRIYGNNSTKMHQEDVKWTNLELLLKFFFDIFLKISCSCSSAPFPACQEGQFCERREEALFYLRLVASLAVGIAEE